MKPRTILTAVILAFVAASVAYLVVKEVRAARATDVARAGVAGASPAELAPAEAIPAVSVDRVVVTYFYTSRRCATCKNIEAYTREAVEAGFADEVKSGLVCWRSVNTDEPANRHYINDYRLYAKSVIVSDVRGGEEARWKNLADIWRLTNDKAAFVKYIQDEVRGYLEAA
jgi:hypothetical protein